MADLCPVCSREFVLGGCPIYGAGDVESELECARLGLQLRDAKLAALTERTKGVLRRVVAELDGALGEQPAPELQMRPEVDPEGSAPGSEGFAK